MILIFVMLFVVCNACTGDYNCNGCNVCVNQTCMPFDTGEKCIPPNNDIASDLQLYYNFFYLQSVLITDFRCLPYGVSVKYVKGLPSNTNMTKQEFTNKYKHLISLECNGWGFVPIENL